MGNVRVADVARSAGVSAGTVSNYLNQPELLAPETIQRVRAAIDELGYVRNVSARSLRTGRASSVGLLMLDISNPFFMEFVDGAEAVALAAGYAAILGNSRESAATEARYLDVFAAQQVSGIILVPVGNARKRMTQFRDAGTPCVLIDDADDLDDFCTVAVSDRLGGGMAIRHLVSVGRRDLVVLTGPRRIHQVHARVEGAIESARAAGASITEVRATAFTTNAAWKAMSGALAARPANGFDGVFAANDVMAIGALQAIHEAGLDCPGDIALVGCDDIAYAGALSPGLTSIRQPAREMGAEAMRLLVEEMTGVEGHYHHRVVFKPSLVRRETA